MPNVYIDTGNAPISNDPETSFLDRWCYDVDNLNVVDGRPCRSGMNRPVSFLLSSCCGA